MQEVEDVAVKGVMATNALAEWREDNDRVAMMRRNIIREDGDGMVNWYDSILDEGFYESNMSMVVRWQLRAHNMMAMDRP
mmetsp:Transcript_22016/g.47864  ORF Transcript_22016/g.47864 Transcript_22016/m.47864 type:complete len:80 (+) Transcript_22016:724-963(+)